MKFFLQIPKHSKILKCYLPMNALQKILICDCKDRCKFEPPPPPIKSFSFNNFEKNKIELKLENQIN